MKRAVEKCQKLATLLYGKTLRRQLDWKIDGESGVSVELGSVVIYMEQGVNENYEKLFRFILLQDGFERDRFTDEDLGASDVPTGLDDIPNYMRLCEALFTVAFRQASGTDNVIDTALTFLLATEE